MVRHIGALLCCLLAFGSGRILAGGDLIKDGKLAAPLKVTQLQGGFAGFTGVRYEIQLDGAWKSVTLFNDKATPKGGGKLSAKQLESLGALLEKYKAAELPAKSGKQPGANPHLLHIELGKKKSSLVGQMPPKLDKTNPTGSVESRFAGIWQGVVGLLKATDAGKEDR